MNSGDLVEMSSTEGGASTLWGFGVKFGVVGFCGCGGFSVNLLCSFLATKFLNQFLLIFSLKNIHQKD